MDFGMQLKSVVSGLPLGLSLYSRTFSSIFLASGLNIFNSGNSLTVISHVEQLSSQVL